jgi:hypothetical protein
LLVRGIRAPVNEQDIVRQGLRQTAPGHEQASHEGAQNPYRFRSHALLLVSQRRLITSLSETTL